MFVLPLLLDGASPAAAADLVVTTANEIRLYDQGGTLLGTRAVPWPGGPRPGTEVVRDVVHVGDYVVTYNGTFEPWVSALNTRTNRWTDLTVAGWDTADNASFGGLAVDAPFVYVTDMATCCDPSDALAGIVRFDARDGSAVRFDPARDYIDLTLGLDGALYGLEADERTLRVVDPVALVLLRTVVLQAAVRAVAVATNGVVWGASWDDTLYAFSPTGNEIGRLRNAAVDLIDVDTNQDDLVVVGSRLGEVVLVDGVQGLETGRFTVGSGPVFVAFR